MINLDHTGRLFFFDKDRNGIFYFDSCIKPEREIKILMNKLKRQHDSVNRRSIKTDYNRIRHQYKNSECGTYCINFIITMLTTNINFKTFCNKKINDDEMLEKRKEYFLLDKLSINFFFISYL